MLKRLFDFLNSDISFTKNVAKVFSGSALATIISVITLPIITGLFTPDDYGLFQLLISFSSLFISIGSLKYEMAIVLPKKEELSNNIIILSLVVLCITTTIFSVALYLTGDLIFELLKAKELSPYLPYISIGIFLGGLIEVIKYILIWKKKFGQLASYRVAQASVNQGMAIGFGYFAPSFIGLFISHISGTLIHVILFLFKYKLPFRQARLNIARQVVRTYSKFPTVNASSVFINNLSAQLPIFMFSIYFNAEIIGLYNVAYKCVYLPLNFLSSAVSQVFLTQAAEAYQESAHKLLLTYKKLVIKLTLLGLIPLLVVLLLGPFLVSIIFSDEWQGTAVFMQIIIFWMYFQFINASVGVTLSIINKQEYGLVLIVISLITRILAMYFFHDTPEEMLIGLTITVSIFYILYNFMIYRLIKRQVFETHN